MAEQAEHQSTTSLPWWVRACRVGWKVMLYVWGTLIVGIAIGTISNLNTTTANTPLSNLFIIHLAMTLPLPVFSGLGILIVLTALFWFGSRERTPATQGTLSEQDRKHMLGRLRLYYEPKPQQSLQGAVQLELGLISRPAAVQNAVALSLRLPDQPDQPLPPHTSISQAYELAQHELLILGEPGAGKSTLLLELARNLTQQAEQDATQPLPIVLPLSSWAVSRRPLQEWLSEQFALLYDVPRGLSQQWIQGRQLLPLLDGLDEMEPAAYAECIAAINTYHREHLQPLVVCSRTNEYETAARRERLSLHTAIVVQPLSKEQIDAHLANIGKPVAALRTALKKNATLQELATTPLMLQVLLLAYHGTSVRELSQKETSLRQQIWNEYVQRMISRKGDTKRYPPSITIAWLKWLAQQMRAHNQTIFFLEQLQPNWLPTRRRVFYRWSVGLVFGLISDLVYGQGFGLRDGLVGLLAGLGVGLLIAPFVGLFGAWLDISPVEAVTVSWEKLRVGLQRGLVFGLLVGLVVGLIGGLQYGLSQGLFTLLFFGLVFGLIGGLVGLITGLRRGQLTEHLTLSPNTGIRRSVKNGLLFGLINVLLFGLLFGLSGRLSDLGLGLSFGLLVGTGFGLVFGLAATVQHYILRFWLFCTHTFPWKAVPFLDDATTRTLLRRIGRGYGFTHPLLLDYFANLDTQASPTSTPGPSA